MRLACSSATTVLGALLGSALLLVTGSAGAQEEEPASYGIFGAGFHVGGGLGVYQVAGRGGISPGFYPRAVLEYELTNHFSIPMVGRFNSSFTESSVDMTEISVTPGLLLRLREKEWNIALAIGIGARIGMYSARPELVGLKPDAPTAELQGFPIAPELTFKFEYWLTSFLPVSFSASYAPVFVSGEVVHTIEEAITLELVF